MAQIDGLRLIDPAAYAQHGYPHDEWTQLRRESPVQFFDPPGWLSYWAVTKHADIVEVSKQPEIFLNGPGMTMVRARSGDDKVQQQIRTVINMDPPVHRKYRKVGSPYFTPRAMHRLDSLVAETARKLVDGLGREGECDFIPEIASRHPLKVIAHILGVPEEDEPFILRLTNELFGSEDPEFQRSEDRMEGIKQLFMEFWGYFGKIIEDRRANPRDDLASVFANARIDDEPMGELETLGYFLIAFTAGHETTRGGIGGGFLELIERPELRKRWAAEPEITPRAVDEIMRYVTPVNHMMRTASQDYELHGEKIRSGDRLVLFYASANRDEEVFDEPLELRLDRHPNPHLAFGIGEHFCMGAHLARKTSGAIFRELVTRLESVELTGTPQRTASNLVPGFKHMPIRYRLAPAS
ncbi:MAG: cytochrome P450 [Myxococcales bacterium]|nr:cytochrome P450 [Myxococcales bacterium]